MAYFITTPTSRPRIGRSQGATIFWGLISVCFAAGACFYYYKSTENQKLAEKWQDQTLQMQDRLDAIQAEKDHVQAGMAEQEVQVKAREELEQEKETELAAEEMRVEGLGRQNATIAAQNQAQVAMVKKFNDIIHKLDGTPPPDVVERSGRPVLRLPNAKLFAAGDAALTPEGKALLGQIAQAIVGQMDTFELRVVCYTDLGAEAAPGSAKKDGDDPHGAAWNLTSERAAVLSRFFRDQTQLPFLNVIVTARGDAEPIAANAGEERARNRRVEIGVTPLPVPFRAPDPDKTAGVASSSSASGAAVSSSAQGAPAKKKPQPDKTPAQ